MARLGIENSLIQTVEADTARHARHLSGLRTVGPHLVDPDNRRPVDFPVRAAALNQLRQKLTNIGDREAVMSGLFESWQDARIKLAVNTLLLDLRRMQEDLFATGCYEALTRGGEGGPGAGLPAQRGQRASPFSSPAIRACAMSIRTGPAPWPACRRDAGPTG